MHLNSQREEWRVTTGRAASKVFTDVDAHFRTAGDDYQGRVNVALRKAIGDRAG